MNRVTQSSTYVILYLPLITVITLITKITVQTMAVSACEEKRYSKYARCADTREKGAGRWRQVIILILHHYLHCLLCNTILSCSNLPSVTATESSTCLVYTLIL